MIVENNISEIQKVGDIETTKVTIDPSNLEFLTRLLSTNLYSDPLESFFREIVSNAYDSVTAAGEDYRKRPIVISFKESPADNHYVCNIRDYGTGLSKEEFEDIYCKFGTSTKRESNKFIGAFGK